MSGSEKSIRPIRQLSLQPPAPRRQQVRRQRSAEDEKSLQICASPFARGKRGTCKGSERPKVRVAWRETRQKNEEELGQVEVVARQIPGRSKSTSGRSRGIEKSILYSRLELAERLRLAWQNREKNKANINIFLARETLDERCDSEISNGTAPSSPVRINDESKIETPLDNNYKTIRDEDREKEDEKVVRKLGNNDATTSGRIDDKLHVNFLPLEKNKVSVQAKSKEREKVDTEKERVNEQISRNSSVDEYVSIKKKQASDCSNHRVTSTSLPSIKIENSTLAIAKTSREDFSSAKQKRASFHSGTNRAFLDPIRSEIKWSSEKNSFQKSSIDNRVTIVEKNFSKQTIGNKENDTADEKNTPRENNSPYDSITNEKDGMEKIAVVDKSNCVDNKNAQIKTVIENRDNLQDDKTITPREMDRSDSTCRKISSTNDVQVSSRSIIENKDDSTIDKSSSSRNFNSMNDKNPPIKKTVENQKIEQKSRRTNSAPPQRRFESISPNNNRVHVNIGIDSMRKNRNQKDQDVDCKYNTMEKTDTAVTKISSSRGVRSAPLKRRSRSAKRRFCGGSTSKNEEDGKSRNRSGTRAGKNSIDSRTMDIVTMVSLVSSADSDSDIENSFRDDKLIDELRSKLPTTSIIKTSINSALSSARRPIKSVSFQKDSFDEEEYSPSKEQQLSPKEEKRTTESWLAIIGNQRGATSSKEEAVSWKTDVTGGGLTLPILALIHDIEEPLDVPLTDREKRCLAVPICDLHDKKRKLLKTRNTSSRSGIERQITSMKIKRETQESPIIISRKIDISAQQSKTTINNSIVNAKTTCILPSKETLHMQSIEPQFQTNKEKECWHLYKKMCDKGVCVSFDTVLRGMLTPTEYRLRQREVLQNL